ncbi:hypothetical protein B6I21_07135 [candidate division KSB1 bacterium 4572_119]|nr:MAG: hypothetical protein B6I21_07135 [candidate division KSB1 bacterium 4572_119]
MKTITVKLSEDQGELLEDICKMAGKSSSDFVKDTLLTLLPISEYAAVKKYQNSVDEYDGANRKKSKYIDRVINNIHASANARLRRIGIL